MCVFGHHFLCQIQNLWLSSINLGKYVFPIGCLERCERQKSLAISFLKPIKNLSSLNTGNYHHDDVWISDLTCDQHIFLILLLHKKKIYQTLKMHVVFNHISKHLNLSKILCCASYFGVQNVAKHSPFCLMKYFLCTGYWFANFTWFQGMLSLLTWVTLLLKPKEELLQVMVRWNSEVPDDILLL